MPRNIIGRRSAGVLLTLSGLFFSPADSARATIDDVSHGVSADGLGNVYISGFTYGSLGGPTAGDYDAFLVKLEAGGAPLSATRYGDAATDQLLGVAP